MKPAFLRPGTRTTHSARFSRSCGTPLSDACIISVMRSAAASSRLSASVAAKMAGAIRAETANAVIQVRNIRGTPPWVDCTLFNEAIGCPVGLLHEGCGVLGKRQHSARQNTEEKRTNSGQHQRRLQRGTRRFEIFGDLARLMHVHHDHQTKVVVSRHRAVQQAEHSEPGETRMQGGAEDVEFTE